MTRLDINFVEAHTAPLWKHTGDKDCLESVVKQQLHSGKRITCV